MISINNYTVQGRVGQAPEVLNLPGGKRIAKFSVATNEYYNEKEHTEWHNVTMFGQRVDYIEKHLNKGDIVLVSGKHTTRSWEDKDGNKRYSSELAAFQVTKDFAINKPIANPEHKEPQTIEENTDDLPF